MNTPAAHWVLEQRYGGINEPYAMRTPLGWVCMGPAKETNSLEANVDHLLVEDSLFNRLDAMWALEFDEPNPLARPVSMEDKEAISLLEADCLLIGGHIELPLPWRKGSPCL
ncbi:unnamed protein product [Echinostoma caproni]|uniref:RibD_C domain-containing protein n=1 Tax=Echinostoma caproni TaxID=27848 RepID=A0A183BCP3_9TREM|nr:unnamed protein product [Echinostoma caproni]